MKVNNPLLAYYDSIARGLVPVKILAVDGDRITVKVTADRGNAFRRGDVFETANYHIVRRSFRQKMKHKIVTPVNRVEVLAALEGGKW